MPNPHCEEAVYWDAALDAYHDDRVVDAWQEIESHGVGEAGANIRWYRLIEAESTLRRRCRFHRASKWLTLETIPEETLSTEAEIAELFLRTAEMVGKNLNWPHEADVLVSILSRASECPWATNPNGYWVNKEPYDKICLPFYLLDDQTELRRAFAHEYAHVVCGGLSDEHAPTWLHEAVSASAELLCERDVALSPANTWLQPVQLEGILDSESIEDSERIFTAYQQCGWIGSYLLSIGGPAAISKLLIQHRNEGFAGNLWRVLRGRERVDGAVKRLYALSVNELFEQARLFMLREGVGA